MTKNMYQKRKERQNKIEEVSTNKTNINWDNPTDRKPLANLYEMGICEK